MAIRRYVVPVVTDENGDADVNSPYISGKLISIRYVKTDFASGCDFVLEAEATGEAIWSEENVNASATRYPRVPTHSTAGAAALYASGGEAVNGKIVLGHDRVNIVVSDGGDTKSGAFHFTIDG